MLGSDETYDYWLYEHSADDGAWVEMPAFDKAELPPFVFGEPDTLTFANPMPVPQTADGMSSVIFTDGLVANPSMVVMPDGTYLALATGALRSLLFGRCVSVCVWVLSFVFFGF